MTRLMWLAFFCHLIAFVMMHGGMGWISGRVESGETGFEIAHDRALGNAMRRAEQLAYKETEVGRKVRELSDRVRVLKMMENEVRR